MQLINEVRSDLTKLIAEDLGPAAGANFNDRLLDWLHFKARSIPPRPRSVRVSDEVARRTADFPAIDAIKAELENGADLRPRLSDRVRKRQADPYADIMYNDWQIIHFHLGEEYVAANKIERTDDLLFAYIGKDQAVLLDVKPHRPRPWSMKALLQVLLRTAPDVMRNAELHNIHESSNEDLSDDEIFTLRSKGTNAAIKIDGRFFRAPGQGLVASQHALRLVLYRDRFYEMVAAARAALVDATLAPVPPMIAIQAQLGIKLEAGELVAYEKLRGIELARMRPLD